MNIFWEFTLKVSDPLQPCERETEIAGCVTKPFYYVLVMAMCCNTGLRECIHVSLVSHSCLPVVEILILSFRYCLSVCVTGRPVCVCERGPFPALSPLSLLSH